MDTTLSLPCTMTRGVLDAGLGAGLGGGVSDARILSVTLLMRSVGGGAVMIGKSRKE